MKAVILSLVLFATFTGKPVITDRIVYVDEEYAVIFLSTEAIYLKSDADRLIEEVYSAAVREYPELKVAVTRDAGSYGRAKLYKENGRADALAKLAAQTYSKYGSHTEKTLAIS